MDGNLQTMWRNLGEAVVFRRPFDLENVQAGYQIADWLTDLAEEIGSSPVVSIGDNTMPPNHKAASEIWRKLPDLHPTI